MTRCLACNRFISPRWRRCPWCKRWTGVTHGPADAAVDSELHAFASIGIPAGLWVAGLGLALLESGPTAGGLTIALGLVLSAASVFLLWFRLAYLVALICWAALFIPIGRAMSLDPHGAWPALCIPTLTLTLLAARLPVLFRRLSTGSSYVARPPSSKHGIGRCERCGAGGASTRAPLYVFSGLWVSVQTHGLARELCPRHARIYALPASVVTFLFGWWGLWGLFWTPTALIANLTEGGASHADLDGEALSRRRAGWRWFAPLVALVIGLFVFPLASICVPGLLVGTPS